MLSLILGLGNVGERYKKSRHNLGFMVLEALLADKNLKLRTTEKEYYWITEKSPLAQVVYALPRTYMNLSGVAADVLLKRYDLDSTRMLVIVDDFNLPLGKIRIRKSGSDGGHNGLASIIECLETEDFPRMRLGIGPIPDEQDTVKFVLGDFELEELKTVDEMIKTASQAITEILETGLEEAMTKYNRNPA